MFTTVRKAGAHWVTYRRRPLAETTATAKEQKTLRGGKQVTMMLADETIDLKDYGPARQLSLFEDELLVLQVLTSDTQAAATELVCWLRARWRIENFFKYASEHHGIDALADYRMNIEADTHKVANPARTEARQARKTAEDQVAAAERALAQLIDDDTITTTAKNAAIPEAQQHIKETQMALQAATEALKPIPAKLPANQIDPEAKLARPRLERRGLQMVLRLLAYNAEAWLADRLNAYLTDPDEHRAITRHLLHQGGRIEYARKAIHVHLDRPDTPRAAGALQLLAEELTRMRPRIPGDTRPITYTINQR